MVVLATKSLESPALQSEFPAQVLFSESFCSEKFLGDPEAHVQIRSRKGKRKVKDRVLNIREHEIWTRGDLEAQSNVCLVSCFFSTCRHSTCFRSSVLSPNMPCPLWLISIPPWYSTSPDTGNEARKACRPKLFFHSHPSMWGSERKPPTLSSCAPSPAVQTLLIFLKWSLWGYAVIAPHGLLCLHTRMRLPVLPPWSSAGHVVMQNTCSFS